MDLSGEGQRSCLVRWAGLMNGSRIAAKSGLASTTFARELLCLNGASPMLNITSQCHDPDFFFLLLEYIV